MNPADAALDALLDVSRMQRAALSATRAAPAPDFEVSPMSTKPPVLRLIHTATGAEIKVGDVVRTFRGEEFVLRSFDRRRVYLDAPGESAPVPAAFYAGVIDARVEEVRG